MVHGKKGFERVLWACKNVLNDAVTWLFCDLRSAPYNLEKGRHSLSLIHHAALTSCSDSSPTPLTKHHATTMVCSPVKMLIKDVMIPPFVAPSAAAYDHRQSFEELSVEISEWLALVTLDSARIRSGDTIDPYLSRYEVPNLAEANSSNLVRVKWSGFLHGAWITSLLVACV